LSDVLAAFFLGLSFGNLWLCALLVFSLQTTNRLTCAGYLVGRAAALLALAVAVAAVGQLVVPDHRWLNLASGVLLVGFSVHLAATQLLGWVPPWGRTRAPQDHSSPCNGACESCPTREVPHLADVCADCADDKACAAEEPEVEALTRSARGRWGRDVTPDRRSGFAYGAALGALRGAALCGKLIVLLPMLIGSTIPRAVGVAAAFTLSSSLYPLAGFLFGSFALRLVPFKRRLFAFGCVLLACTGGFYLLRGLSG
jgi:hypothetical protein